MQYVLQYFYNKKWDIRNTRNNEKSDSVELIRGLQGPPRPRAPHTSRKQRAFLYFSMLSDEALREV